jgi:alpha/beta hydrolase family protein
MRNCRRGLGAALSLLLALAGASLAHAEVTRVEFTLKQPFGSFRAGEFVILEGKVHGELSLQESIPGIDKAPRNARGRVEYAARLVLIVPGGQARGNGTLLVDVPNRGRAYAQALYNSPRDEPFASGTFEQGTGFLQDQGYSVAEVYWELGQGADLPSFVDSDGKKRYVEGAGFAIVRDTADFLARAATDSTGASNPLKGLVSRTIGVGKSQDGRFLKTFLLHGFNMTGGRRVFDGMHVIVSASGLLPILQTGTGPESSANGAPTFANPEFPGVNDGPLTIGEIIASVEARREVPPKMILVNSDTDYFSLRASLGRTGGSGTADLAIPQNVRMYDVAGAPHVVVAKMPAPCKMPQGRLDWAPVLRATLTRLDAWVAINAEPPANELMPLEAARGEPPALGAPAKFASAVIQVPKRDPDGNALGGVRLPDLAAPLGTHSGQNVPDSFLCALVGSYTAFAVTKEQRESKGDARRSLFERYRNRDDYVNRIRTAAHDLMERGFLLPEDAAIIVQSAAANPLFVRQPAR